MIKRISTYLILFFFFINITFLHAQTDSLINYVDPFIGVRDEASNCVIGPQLPFGSINPSPQTKDGSHDGYDPDQPIRGFGQLHASGTGWGKYGQVFISPQTGLKTAETAHDSPKSNEKAKPFEYAVNLTRYGINVNVTPSFHSAIYRFKFPASDSSAVLFDLAHNIPMDIADIGGSVKNGQVYVKDSVVYGSANYEGGFAPGFYKVYFYAQFSKMASSFGTWKNQHIFNGDTTGHSNKVNERLGAYTIFETVSDEEILLKVGISFKSVEQAKYWLYEEIPDWNYTAVKQNAIDAWEEELGKIKIETPNITDKKLFYTALYHTMLMPRNRTNDIEGYGADEQIWDDQYAIWDTWRTLYPLMAIINPEMVAGNVNSFITRYNKSPQYNLKDVFIAGNNMPEEQGGNDMDNIIADAYFKKIPGINWNDAYKILKYNATSQRRGWQGWGNYTIANSVMANYKTKGWIPAGQMSCSYTLEYAYNDFCAASVAKALGKSDESEAWFQRSVKWQHLWNPEANSYGYSGFIVPRKTNLDFLNVNLEKYWGSWNNYFYEASSWTYSFFVPHQFQKLIELCGGEETFTKKLKLGLTNRLIDLTNEPALLAIQAFHHANRPDLASYWNSRTRANGFNENGYPGNEDSGTMSSWYIFSSIGLFPNSGQPFYYLNAPNFPKSVIYLSNNDSIVIEAENYSEENIYIQSCTINGIKHGQSWVHHDSIGNGAEIKFVLGSTPSEWGTQNHFPEFDRELNPSSSVNPVHKNENSFRILSNPGSSEIEITGKINQKHKSVVVKIQDTLGREIKTFPLNPKPDFLIQLNSDDFNPGIYFCTLLEDGKVVGAEKMLVTQ